jgi:hypothetical protein
MAYKEETDQQFMESIIKQASRPGRSFNGARMGFQNLDDNPDPEDINPFSARGNHAAWDTPTGYRNRYQAAMSQKSAQDKGPAMSAFHLKQQYPDMGLGGYSSDQGRHTVAPEANGPRSLPDSRGPLDGHGSDLDYHAEMGQVKKLIKDKERELHELQRQKVELMRKITGRL